MFDFTSPFCVGSTFNPFPNKPCFSCVCSTSLLKTLWEKEKLLITRNFSFTHSVFYSSGELYTIFIQFKIVFCKVSIWKSLKFVAWERVNIGLIHVFEVVNIRRGLKNGLTPECEAQGCKPF